jgi:hypothetical protein
MRARHLIAGLMLVGVLAVPQPSQAQLTLPSPGQFCIRNAEACLFGALFFPTYLYWLEPLIQGNNCAYGFSPTNHYEFGGFTYTSTGAAVQQGSSNLTCAGCEAAKALSNNISLGENPGICAPSNSTFSFASQFCGFGFDIPLGTCANAKYSCLARLPGSPAQCCPLNPPAGRCF